MSFVPTQCPNCLKSIQVPTDIQISKCMYCGADVPSSVLSAVAPSVSLSNLLGMARTASLAGNVSEAESYYNRVLELDPKNSEAWLGKGKSAAWQSSIANIRTGEMVIAFNHAIGTTDDVSRESVVNTCVHEANHIIVTLYGMANKHMHEFVAAEGTWSTYLAQIAQLLDGLNSVLAWNPNNKITLENIVHLCKDNIEGVTFRDPLANNMPKAWSLSEEYEKIVRGELEAASEKLKLLDPDYVTPIVEKKRPDACFVVTATMGDENNPTVTLLRRFRAEVLSGNPAGDRFISWYYKTGPKVADFIKHSNRRRFLSYFIIVAPAAFIASSIFLFRRKLDALIRKSRIS
ncbi:MAG: tetratricopeptide repeat protein [Pseudomonadaceae bacterium]